MRRTAVLGLVGLTAALVAAPVAQAAPGATVVTPAATAGWTESVTGGGDVAFVPGPATPPLGAGSAELAVGPNGADSAQLRLDGAGGALEDLTLVYGTHVTSNVNCQAPYAIARIDHGGDGTVDDQLFFEPCYQSDQGPVATGTWQTWNATDGGWWSLDAGTFGPPLTTLADYAAANPDSVVRGVRLVAGFGAGAWDGFVGNVDAVTVNGTTYDFEPQPMLGDCAISRTGDTITLVQDCTTDGTIVIPDGVTFDGAGHTITGVDPAGGHFLGAVLRNGGATAYVRNVTVTVAGLADVCDGGADRLRGILFDGAAGSITDNRVLGINQGASGCQEGNAIEVRNAPFDATGQDLAVTISGNEVADHQKTGVLANGSVAATIVDNVVAGAGPIDHIAQNGVQIGFGATGTVSRNTISGNDYTPESDVACGLLFFQADGVRQSQNELSGNERNLCNFGRGGGKAAPDA